MNTPPSTLARSLAQRIGRLPDVSETPLIPEVVPTAVQRAAFDALDAGHTHYTDRPGILPLRQKIATDLQARYGIVIDASAITITCGVIEARFIAVKQLVKPWHFIFCPSSAHWRTIAHPALLIGAETTGSLDHPALDMIYATPADSAEDIQRVGEHLPDAFIVFDTAVAGAGEWHPAQRWADRTVTIGEFETLSGWRVGWMAGSKAANKLRAYKQSMTICSTSISQWAALGVDT
jgi:aspartate/methionine/tyrosine aminotransferase